MCCPVCTRFAVHTELPISAKNTFEERIDQMIQDKRHLADMTVASGESWIGKLSNSELREIFR